MGWWIAVAATLTAVGVYAPMWGAPRLNRATAGRAGLKNGRAHVWQGGRWTLAAVAAAVGLIGCSVVFAAPYAAAWGPGVIVLGLLWQAQRLRPYMHWISPVEKGLADGEWILILLGGIATIAGTIVASEPY